MEQNWKSEEDSKSEASGVYAATRSCDPSLVSRLLAGDSDAGETFYLEHVDQVRGVCFKILGPGFDQEDLVHDVFVESLANLSRLRNPDALRSWVVGIAIRMCRRRLRTRSRRSWLCFLAPEDVPEERCVPNGEASVALTRIYELLRKVPEDDGIALVLRRIEGMSLVEGAEACGVSLATFKRRLRRGEDEFLRLAGNEQLFIDWSSS